MGVKVTVYCDVNGCDMHADVRGAAEAELVEPVNGAGQALHLDELLSVPDGWATEEGEGGYDFALLCPVHVPGGDES